MQRVGDDGAGFSVDVDVAANAIRVRAWGFWTADVAAEFRTIVSDACRNRPRGASLAFDMTELKPMRDEGQKAFGSVLAALPRLGITNATVSTGSQLTKLQLLRISGEHQSTLRFT
jgi:hypothetical protein